MWPVYYLHNSVPDTRITIYITNPSSPVYTTSEYMYISWMELYVISIIHDSMYTVIMLDLLVFLFFSVSAGKYIICIHLYTNSFNLINILS